MPWCWHKPFANKLYIKQSPFARVGEELKTRKKIRFKRLIFKLKIGFLKNYLQDKEVKRKQNR